MFVLKKRAAEAIKGESMSVKDTVTIIPVFQVEYIYKKFTTVFIKNIV